MTQVRNSLLAITVIALAACGGHAAAPVAKQPTPVVAATPTLKTVTTYYTGTTEMAPPESKEPRNPRPYIVERTVDPEEHQLVEKVLVHGTMTATTMTATADPNVFTATDENKSFTGTITYKGKPWAWTSWHYDLKMADGSGTISGDATVTDDNIDTVKRFASPDGIVRMVIKDHIKPVDESVFMDTWRQITSR